MRAKEFLNQAYQLDRRIRYKKVDIDYLKEVVADCSISYDGMPKNPYPGGSVLENKMVKIIAMEDEVREEMNRLALLKAEILDVISQVESEDCRLVLQRRYLHYEGWEEIWEDLCKSRSWVMKTHKKALDAVDGILENRKN